MHNLYIIIIINIIITIIIIIFIFIIYIYYYYYYILYTGHIGVLQGEAIVDGKPRAVFKDPVTDQGLTSTGLFLVASAGKKSKQGRLKLVKGPLA